MIIVRYSEIGLKGKNRRDFEKQLQLNIRHCLKKNKIPFEQVARKRGRILIITKEKVPQLQYIFGVSSYSYVQEFIQDFDEIKKAALTFYKKGTFRVKVQRSDKVLMNSPELAAEIGAYIVEKTNAPVDLHNPEAIIHIELVNERAYIYSEKIPGLGGLPLGSTGRVVLILENKDSINAAIKVMKRGCRVDVLKKKDIDYSELEKYAYGYTIKEAEAVEDYIAVVVSDTIDTIKEYPYFVLRPLV